MEEKEQSETSNLEVWRALSNAAFEDATKFYTKGTASAAARFRKKASQLSKLNKVLRKEIQTAKKQKVAERKASKNVD